MPANPEKTSTRKTVARLHRRAPLRLVALVPFLVLGLPGSVDAQGRLDVGVHGAFASELAGGTPGIGARFSTGLEPLLRDVRVQATGDLFFPGCEHGGDCGYRELNVNLILDGEGRRSRGGSYLGAGVNVQQIEIPDDPRGPVDDVEYGLNVLLGFGLEPQGAFQPFVEGRVEFLTDGIEQFVLGAGIVL